MADEPVEFRVAGSFYETNAFQGWLATTIGIILTVVGMFSRAIIAHWLLGFAWICGTITLWKVSLIIRRRGWRRFSVLVASLLTGVSLAALDWNIIPRAPTPPSISPLAFSLKMLTTEESLLFLKNPLGSNNSFYRFQVTNGNGDISDLTVALDLPALLAKQPILIDKSGANDLMLKAAFSAYTRTTPQNRTERISSLGNTVIIEISRLRQFGSVDVGLVTAPIKAHRLTMMTAPDGSIQLTVAPGFGRYGSVSARRRLADNRDYHESFPIGPPVFHAELIDLTKPLRPESRSTLSLLTQDEILQAEKDGVKIRMEQHFR